MTSREIRDQAVKELLEEPEVQDALKLLERVEKQGRIVRRPDPAPSGLSRPATMNVPGGLESTISVRSIPGYRVG